jgi:hypothetical protein
VQVEFLTLRNTMIMGEWWYTHCWNCISLNMLYIWYVNLNSSGCSCVKCTYMFSRCASCNFLQFH